MANKGARKPVGGKKEAKQVDDEGIPTTGQLARFTAENIDPDKRMKSLKS